MAGGMAADGTGGGGGAGASAVVAPSDPFQSLAGVRPSPVWIRACRSHLLDRGGGGGDDDAVLHEILHSDLRDVVRLFGEGGDDDGGGGGGGGAGTGGLTQPSVGAGVRRAISQSLPRTGSPDAPCKAVLPPTLRLMVQVEECLDVSLNAEARAAVGPASPTAPAPVGDQRNRCLKMLLSDGYYDDGSASPPTPPRDGGTDADRGDRGHLLVAMETSPIPDLSVHSRPGIKVLLRGPITVRFGVLMLNEGCATVLGGCVPALIPVQKKAREMAARAAGVGVDPTIKALIWNPDAGADEEEDEGEEASGDVRARPPLAPAPVARPPVADVVNRGPPAAVQNANPHHHGREAGNGVAPGPGQRTVLPYRQPQNPGQCVPMDVGGAPSQQGPPTTRPRHDRQQRQQWEPPPEPTDRSHPAGPGGGDGPPAARGSPTRPRPGGAVGNPYASSGRNPYVPSSSSSSAAAPPATSRGPPAPSIAARDDGPGGVDVVDLASPEPSPSPAPPETPRPTESAAAAAADPTSSSTTGGGGSSAPRSSQESTVSTDGSGTGAVAVAAAAATPTPGAGGAPALSPTALSEPVSFAELRSLLLRVVRDPSLYGSYQGRTFIVPAKLEPSNEHVHFNIEKVKGAKHKRKKGGKDGKSYQYLMTCRFMGTDASEGYVSCRVASALLEPFIGITPAELRKIHKEDKMRGNNIVNECGRQILVEYGSLASFRMRLFLSKEEFFKQEKVPIEVDGSCPILLVFGRDDI